MSLGLIVCTSGCDFTRGLAIFGGIRLRSSHSTFLFVGITQGLIDPARVLAMLNSVNQSQSATPSLPFPSNTSQSPDVGVVERSVGTTKVREQETNERSTIICRFYRRTRIAICATRSSVISTS